MSTLTSTAVPGLRTGTWIVDPQAGRVGFRVKTMWGLSEVKGTFDRFEGALEVSDVDATGELVVHSDSLNTNNKKRDEHLRSADFFDAKSHPRVTFTATAVKSGPSGLVVSGELTVGAHRTPLDVPAVLESAGDDAVTLRAGIAIPREDVGLRWNKLGMIRRDARLDIELRLIAPA